MISLAVAISFIAGSVTLPGCSNPADTVVTDTSGAKNKRITRIEKIKAGETTKGPKKEAPQP
jgi:hypothetical protein